MDEACDITTLWMRDYGTGSFKRRDKRRADGSTHKEWVGYVYALSNGARINGTGRNEQSAERKAKRNARIYDALVGGGTDDATARKTLDRINRGPLRAADPDEVIGALGLRPFELRASALLSNILPPATVTPSIKSASRPDKSTNLHDFIDFVVPRMSRSKKVESRRRTERFGHMLCEHVPAEGGPPLGERPVSEIWLDYLEDMIEGMRERHREGDSEDGDNYLADFRGFVSRVFKKAYNYELTNRDYEKGLPSVARPAKKELTIDDADIARLFEAADDPRLRAYLVIGYMGVGINELLGLTTDDIVGNTINLRGQLGRAENPLYDPRGPKDPEVNPKTVCALLPWMKRASRKRAVVLTDELMKVVMESIEFVQAETRLYYPDPKLSPEDRYRTVRMVIPNESGGAWQCHNFRLKWNELCRRAGVKMTPHEFRALLTVDERERGEDLDVLAKVLGHASSSTTEKSYLRRRRGSETVRRALEARAARCESVLAKKK